MKKRVFGRKFSRNSSSRRAMFRMLVRAFFKNQSLKTTYAKAKAVIPIIEKYLNLAKEDGLSKKRFIYRELGNDRETCDRIFEFAKQLEKRPGGYLKMVNISPRKGDNAPMVRLEFFQKINLTGKEERKEKVEKEKEKKTRKSGENDSETAKGKSKITKALRKISIPKIKTAK